jgi:hypothetical protein
LYLFDTFHGLDGPELSFTPDNKLFLHKNNVDRLWLMFDPGALRQWRASMPGTDTSSYWMATLESTTDSLTVPAGHFENVCRFHFSWIGADNDWIEWYAPFVGPVKRTLLGFGVIDYELVSFTVDSTTTGKEDPVPSSPVTVELGPLYPNPATLAVQAELRIHAPMNAVSMTITDVLGRVLMRQEESIVAPGRYVRSFPVRQLPAGTYTLMLRSENNTVSRHFAVVR